MQRTLLAVLLFLSLTSFTGHKIFNDLPPERYSYIQHADIGGYIECGGNKILIAGSVLMAGHYIMSDNNITIKISFAHQNVKGYGEDGSTYRVPTVHEYIYVDTDPLEEGFKVVNNIQPITIVGRQEKYHLNYRWHMTFDKAGNVSAEVFLNEYECY